MFSFFFNASKKPLTALELAVQETDLDARLVVAQALLTRYNEIEFSEDDYVFHISISQVKEIVNDLVVLMAKIREIEQVNAKSWFFTVNIDSLLRELKRKSIVLGNRMSFLLKL